MKYSSRIIIALILLLVGAWSVINAPSPLFAADSTPEHESNNSKNAGLPFLPGNIENGIKGLNLIRGYVNSYRLKHNGSYPSSISNILEELLQEKKLIGKEGLFKGINLLSNVDNQYADSSWFREEPQRKISYIVTNLRPDGTFAGSPKLAGTLDAIARTNIYFHLNYHRFSHSTENRAGEINPVGYFLVLWNSGEVSTIPYDEMFYTSSSDTKHSYKVVYPAQAGVSNDTLTYQDFWTGLNNKQSNIIGKPIVKDEEVPISDNNGPEALVTLSRLLIYPNRYGIDREKLWQTFSPAQEEFTLQETQVGVQKLGLSLQLRKLSLDELEQLNTPALFLTTDDKRIVTLANLDDKEAIVIDRGLTHVVSRDILAQKYGGEALVPRTAQTPSAVAVTDPVRVLNFSSTNAEVGQQVTITNRGKERLTLQIERPIPGVTSAELSSDSLVPGASATLSLTIKWRDILKGDTQNVFVFLKTNDPVRPRLQLGFKLQQHGAKTP